MFFFLIFNFLVFTPLELKIWILAGGRGEKKGNKKKKKNVELMILEMALIFVMNFLTFFHFLSHY